MCKWICALTLLCVWGQQWMSKHYQSVRPCFHSVTTTVEHQHVLQNLTIHLMLFTVASQLESVVFYFTRCEWSSWQSHTRSSRSQWCLNGPSTKCHPTFTEAQMRLNLVHQTYVLLINLKDVILLIICRKTQKQKVSIYLLTLLTLQCAQL